MAITLAALDTAASVATRGYAAAKWLNTTIRHARQAPDTWEMTRNDFLTFTETRVKILSDQVKNLTASSHTTMTPYNKEVIKALKGLVAKLNDDLAEIRNKLGSEPPHGVTDRLVFALRDDSALQQHFAQTETHAGELLSWLLVLNLDAHRQSATPVAALEKTVLRCSNKTDIANMSNTRSALSPRLYTAKAQYNPTGRSPFQIHVLAETFHAPDTDLERDILRALETIATLLGTAMGSSNGGSATGLLPCLGYQINREPDKSSVKNKNMDTEEKALMFWLPGNAATPQTLRDTIAPGMGSDRGPFLKQRFDLARQLADTVFRLHTASLLHKNIRGDSIFLLKANGDKTTQEILELIASSGAAESSAIDSEPEVPIPAKKGIKEMAKKVKRSVSESRMGRSISRMVRSKSRNRHDPNPSPESKKRMEEKKKSSSVTRTLSKTRRSASQTQRKKSPASDVEDDSTQTIATARTGRPRNEPVTGGEERRGRSDSPRPATGAVESAIETQIQPQWLEPGRTVAILTHWSDAKKTGEISATSGPSKDNWPVKMYRHPSQQSEEDNDMYHFGHDIYSLGVCLLEIGLWDCLVYPSCSGTASLASRLLMDELYAQYVDPLKAQLSEALGSKEDPERQLETVVKSSLMGSSTLDIAYTMKRLLRRKDDSEIRHTISRIASRTPLSTLLAHRCWLLEAVLGVVMDTATSSRGDIATTHKVFRSLYNAIPNAIKSEDVQKHIKNRATSLARQTKADLEIVTTHTDERLRAAERLSAAVGRCVTEGGVGASTLKSLDPVDVFLRNEATAKRNASTGTGNRGAELAKAMKREAYSLEDRYYVLPKAETVVNDLLQEREGRKILQETLVRLAKGKMCRAMGDAYSEIVVKCLRAVEDGFGGVSGTERFDFSIAGQDTAACLLLEKAVVGPLRRVNLGT